MPRHQLFAGELIFMKSVAYLFFFDYMEQEIMTFRPTTASSILLNVLEGKFITLRQ